MDRLLAIAIVALCIPAMWLIIYDHLLVGWTVLIVAALCWARLTGIISKSTGVE